MWRRHLVQESLLGTNTSFIVPSSALTILRRHRIDLFHDHHLSDGVSEENVRWWIRSYVGASEQQHPLWPSREEGYEIGVFILKLPTTTGSSVLYWGEVFHDMTGAPGEDGVDGIKVDQQGNLYVCGPGGVTILSPQGQVLGMITGPEIQHNLAWGDEDGQTLYMTAMTGIYRIRLNIPGVRP